MIEAALVLGVIMVGFWLISIPLGKVSYIDSLWGLGFVINAWAAAYFATDGTFAIRGLGGSATDYSFAGFGLGATVVSLFIAPLLE